MITVEMQATGCELKTTSVSGLCSTSHGKTLQQCLETSSNTLEHSQKYSFFSLFWLILICWCSSMSIRIPEQCNYSQLQSYQRWPLDDLPSSISYSSHAPQPMTAMSRWYWMSPGDFMFNILPEQQCLSLFPRRNSSLLHNQLEILRISETGVDHSIGLIDDEILDLLQTDNTLVHKLLHAIRRADEDGEVLQIINKSHWFL